MKIVFFYIDFMSKFTIKSKKIELQYDTFDRSGDFVVCRSGFCME